MQAHYHSDVIWTIEDFLSQKECNDLISFSERKGYKEAKKSFSDGTAIPKGIQDNYRLTHIDADLAQTYWQKLKCFCPDCVENSQAIGLSELFRFYKYDFNQKFKKHIDGRFKISMQTESRITLIVYLNDDFEGGEVKFDKVTITPKAGMALCFVHEQKHEGCPVPEGTKYILRTDIMYSEMQ